MTKGREEFPVRRIGSAPMTPSAPKGMVSMYIGLGTLVVILVVVGIIFLVRRA
jgi:hypothetical protein